jgi:hypothetical protein
MWLQCLRITPVLACNIAAAADAAVAFYYCYCCCYCCYRVKECTPDLGVFLCWLLLSDRGWDQNLKRCFLKEATDRYTTAAYYYIVHYCILLYEEVYSACEEVCSVHCIVLCDDLQMLFS